MLRRFDILTEKDWDTFAWLSDHGYDGNIWEECTNLCTMSELEEDDEDYKEDVYASIWMTDSDILAVKEYIDADPASFLACNGSSTLAEVLQSIYLTEI